MSILRFIEKRWSLDPLGTRDASASDVTSAFDLNQSTNAASSRSDTPVAAMLVAVIVLALVAGAAYYFGRRPRKA